MREELLRALRALATDPRAVARLTIHIEDREIATALDDAAAVHLQEVLDAKHNGEVALKYAGQLAEEDLDDVRRESVKERNRLYQELQDALDKLDRLGAR